MHSISFDRLPIPMSSSTDSDFLKGAGPDNPVNTGVLQDFLQGIKEKIGPEYGRVCTEEERWEVKWEIARQLGVEDEYDPEPWPDPDESGPAVEARRKVGARYNELKAEGRIVEAGQLAELQEWGAKINAYLSREVCFTEEYPDSNWPSPAEPSEEPSEDPSEGVGCFPEIETDPRE